MGHLETLIIAVGLAMDAFAVALGVATSGKAAGGRATFRLSFHFGLFQFLMPVLGWLLGRTVSGWIESVDHWIAFILLAFVGGKMIKGGLSKEEEPLAANPTRGTTLVLLSVATSIDALAVGLSLAMISVDIWVPAVTIGVVTGLLSLLGVRLGHRLGLSFGKRMELLGGVLLVAIGLRILLDHLLG